jgi:two-component system, chemotaxis family, chemotaxis protein CheY
MKNILIVDDSNTMRRMVAASLAGIQETTFLEAATGLEALERLALEPIDLVILDMNMPDMHGLEVLEFLQRYPSYRFIPVIVLTTRGDEESREAALAAGARLYLTKPFLPSALADYARELLGVTSRA